MKPQYLTLPILIISSLFAEISVIYTSDFEAPEGFADGASLSGDWTTTDNTVVITDETAQSGTQSVRIPPADPENILSLHFTPSADTILFADYYMQLTASVLPEMPSFTKPETTALIAVQPSDSGSGEWVFLNGDGSGGGVWFTAGDTVPLDEAGRTGWHRFTLRFNLTLNVWDVYIDGNLLAINLGFFEALTDGSEAINIYGSRQGVAYLDNFSLSAYNPLFDDTDLDGIDDAFETAHGLDDSVNDRNLDPDLDGLSNIQEYLYGTHPKTFDADDGILSKVLFNRTNWYVDSVNGDDVSAVGSAAAPFRSLSAVLSLNDLNPDYVGAGDTVYLTAGEYAPTQTNIDIAGLRIEGTLGNDDVPVTQVGNIKVTADNVTLKNLDFHNAGLTLQNTKGVNATNNLFSGSADTSLSLIGASENVISHNYFASAIHQCVYIYWDKSTEKASNDNLFLSNYFTHRPSEETSQIIYCNWTSANEDSICARNRFVDCAFEETTRGLLKKVIYDGSTWWMVVDHQYSVRFEDCYFKRADRDAPFSEFVIVAGDPDFEWRWDELVNDTWVSSNDEYAITGDYKGWSHAPRVQFVNANENGLAVETSHSAGLLSNSNSNSAPEITSAAITSVDVDSVYHYTVTVSDMDSGDIVTVSAAQLPEWLSFAGTTLSGTPTATEIGTHTVEIIATDSYEATDTQTFILTVNAAGDDNAVIDFDYVSILFDQDYAYSHTGSVSGTVRGLGSGYADYSIRVYSKTDADYLIGTVDIDSDGAWSIGSTGVGQKIARLYNKVDTDTALAEVYGEGETAAGSYVNQNDAPGLNFIASSIELEESAGEQTLLLTGIHDGDHGTQTITISALSDNPGLIADPVVTYDPANSPDTATLSYTPQNGVTGAATITLTLQDDGGTEVVGGIVGWKRLAGKDTKTIRFQVVVGSGVPNNNAPVITSTAVVSVNVDNIYNYTVNAIDTDVGDTVTLDVLQLPEWLSFDGATLSSTPTTTEIGTYTVEIIATDSFGAKDIQTFILTVNAVDDNAVVDFDYVSILFDQNYAYSHTGPVSGTVHGLGLNYSDYNIQVYSKTDADYLIGTVDINPDGSWSISSVGAGQKIARLYSKADTNAALSEVYGEGETAAGNYANQNDAPGLDFIATPVMAEANSSWQTIVLTGIHDGDQGTQDISISAVSEDTDVVYNPVINYDSVNDPTTATLRYAPRPGVAGRATINLTLQDDGGTEVVGGTVGWKRLPGKDTRTVSFEIVVGSGGTNNTAPKQVKPISDISVGKDAAPGIINLYDAFEDAETADKNLTFDITNTNSTFVTSEINSGILSLNYPNTSGTATITILVTDDDPNNPFSTSRTFKVTVKIDVDNDGLSDEFEQAIIDFDPNDNITSLEDVLPEADFDGDGYSNFAEFDRGGSPTDSSETPDWIAGTYRLKHEYFSGKSQIRDGFRSFTKEDPDGVDRIFISRNVNLTMTGSCEQDDSVYEINCVNTYVSGHYFTSECNPEHSTIPTEGTDETITFTETYYTRSFVHERIWREWDDEKYEWIEYECSSLVNLQVELYDEYTVEQMFKEGMNKPYKKSVFLLSSYPTYGLAHYFLDFGSKRSFSYSKCRIGVEWDDGVAEIERYPVSKYLLFEPFDNHLTDINEKYNNFEIIEKITLDGGLTHTIEPNNYKPNTPGRYQLIDLNVTPDLNRDGQIDNTDYAIKAKGGEPSIFKFWVNDDDDSGEFGKEDSPGQIINADANNSQVDGFRDTVDLFAINVNFYSFFSLSWSRFDVIENLQDIEIKLSGSSLNLVDYYETNALYAPQGVNVAKETASAKTIPISTSRNIPTSLSRECLDKMISNGGVVTLLFEGVDDGNLPNDDPLIFHIYHKGRKLVEIEQKIRLDHVENMYHRIDLTQVVSEYGETPSGAASIQTSAPNWPDEMTNDKTFVFVHGYNVDVEAARGWHAEVFKRLHQMGSNARFVAVTWDGATSLDYHKAVFQAFQTGDALNDALSAYTGDVTVAAHSLGNVVVSHAIQDGGFRPDRYYMINAAVPIEAYSYSDIEPDMVEKDWEDELEDGLEHLFSATWHQLFEGTEDHRRFLKWRNRFDKVLDSTQLHNFYSPGEEVLDKRVGVNSASAIGSLFRQGFDFSRGAWKAQELTKGVRWSESLVAAFIKRGQAGWDDGLFPGKYPFTKKEDITDEQLMTKPYFDNFKEDDLTNANPAVASAKAAEKQVQYDLLARGIPALSYAAAVDGIPVLGDAEDPESQNFDMEQFGRTKGQWPTEGHSGEATGDWLHSDFRNVALPYVHKMYQAMINKGNLNEN